MNISWVVVAWAPGGWVRIMGPFDGPEAKIVRDNYAANSYWTKVTVEELQPSEKLTNKRIDGRKSDPA